MPARMARRCPARAGLASAGTSRVSSGENAVNSAPATVQDAGTGREAKQDVPYGDPDEPVDGSGIRVSATRGLRAPRARRLWSRRPLPPTRAPARRRATAL